MVALIYGGSGSGKSAYAEEYIGQIAGGAKKYYLATMQVYGEEGERKVARHKELRNGKGFITIEQARNVSEAADKMDVPCAVLLECMSNLTANEMFVGTTCIPWEVVSEKILQDVKKLQSRVDALVIVMGNVFEDGSVYDSGTMEYLRAMGQIHRSLAELADEVIEVVVGIPIPIKKKQRENLCRS